MGRLVLETLQHIPDLPSLSEPEARQVGERARLLSRALQSELKAEKVYAFIIGEGISLVHNALGIVLSRGTTSILECSYR
ncbi:MAG: hypothetical protein PVH60_05935 [Anaerolineales bacterium]